MNLIYRVFSIFNKKEKIYCLIIIFFMLIGALLEAIGIGAILPLISIMGDPMFLDNHERVKDFTDFWGIQGHRTFIICISTLVLLIYFLKNIYMAWLTKLQIYFSLKKQIVFAKNLMCMYINKPYIYYLDQNTAVLLRNISNGAKVVFTDIMVSVFGLITEIITAVVIWVMLVYVDPVIAVCAAGVIVGLMYLVLRSVKSQIIIQGKQQNEYFAQYVKWINQSFGAIKETKIMHKENYFTNIFAESYQKYGEAYAGFLFISQIPRMVIEVVVTTSMIGIIIIKLCVGDSPQEIVPVLGLLAVASFRLMPSANRIITLINSIKFNMPLFDILYTDLIYIRDNVLCINNEEAIESMIFQREITIKSVQFSYNGSSQQILKDISFVIPKGSFVGIIGGSGAGKTTFIDILLGLLEPTAGEISVDGENIFDNINEWQKKVAYVPQNIYLIDGTIKENIAFGIDDKNVEYDKLIKILKMAEIYDMIQKMPDGLNTKVGERGIKLSGGQKQRIGIARALYTSPEILILDEATSALDNDTERNITQTILKLKGEITIIAIAHRLSTLENCDFKIKFKNGEIDKECLNV